MHTEAGIAAEKGSQLEKKIGKTIFQPAKKTWVDGKLAPAPPQGKKGQLGKGSL